MTRATTRRDAVAGLAATTAALAATAVRGQGAPTAPGDWPTRPINVIVPLQAGSAADVAVRLVLDRVAQGMNQRFTVENVTGASGAIGAARAAAAEPDGYTLSALSGVIMTVLPNVRTDKQLGFDPVTSFAPIAGVATIPTFLAVHSAVPAKTVPELIALAKAAPGKLNYASGGNGSPQHLAAEMFMVLSGTQMSQVSYRGATAAAVDLGGGHVQVMFAAHSLGLPFLTSGNIRYIGYCGAERHPEYPDIPTVAEQGVAGFEYAGWTAFLAPAGTPGPIVATLRRLTAEALADEALRDRLVRAGLGVWARDHEGVARAIREDSARWRAVLQSANIKL